MDKEQWIEVFRETGLSEEQMGKWHRVFEDKYPQEHQMFLEWLGLSSREAGQIRAKFQK